VRAVLEIINRWRTEGIMLNPPASEEFLSRLEEILGIPLADDMRGFYAAADGMRDFTYRPPSAQLLVHRPDSTRACGRTEATL
jgi:hypothetical protein